MEQSSTTEKKNWFNRILYTGGLQRYFPRNEAQIYKSQFTLDVANYCLKDFSSNELNEIEIGCVERLSKKNIEFLNL